jgi:hypothetical protein
MRLNQLIEGVEGILGAFAWIDLHHAFKDCSDWRWSLNAA